ncbi:MAG: hypothetical protein ISR55_09880 [Bacteroidetes bacterium]|nr:hypothetical protein [Bacteroidota bacterium]
MKHHKYLLAAGFILFLAAGFWSCKDPDIPDVPDSKLPKLAVNPPQETVFDVSKGELVSFHIEATANAVTNSDLKNIKFSASYSTGESWDTTWDVKATETKFTVINYEFHVPSTVKEDDIITISITVEDISTLKSSKTYILTVKDLSGLNSFEGIVLGAQRNNDVGGFYATSTNTIFTIEEAKTSGQSTIDLIYFYGSINTATIASPDNIDVFGTGAGKIGELLVQEWSNRNATRFKLIASMPALEWSELTDTRLSQIYATASTPEKELANYLADGTGGGQATFVVFKTSKFKYGIFRVTNISPDYSNIGTITIDVKISK